MGPTISQEIVDRLNAAKVAAHDAGKLLLKYWGNLDGYDHKGKVNLVSAADRASEDFIKQWATARFPTDAILAEETGERTGSSGFVWVVDPLDGTTNFVHGHPMFAVSMALMLDSVAVAGVIYLPATRELFYAAKGTGAFGDRGPIRVSSISSLDSSLVATGLPYSRRETSKVLLEDWRRVIQAAQGIRRMGAAAVDLAYLACGRYDGFWERELKPWDTAAGALIVEEAGGQVSAFDGKTFDPFSDQIAASNGLVHQQLLSALFDDR